MTDILIRPASAVRGEVHLPGDKSVSHRALLVAAIGTHPVRITNLATSDDVAATVRAIETLGARVERDGDDPTTVTVTGCGMGGLSAPGATIDAANAGTLARLVAGLLAGTMAERGDVQPATIVGDASLSSRPMRRIARPLVAMGARIGTSDAGTLPLTVRAGGPLAGIRHDLEVASAQVQSALLLAGLYADGPTTVVEPARVRDHTERMLRRAGVRVERSGSEVTVHPADAVELPDTHVPADPSSAAPLATAAALLPGSLLRLPGVMLNPGRTAFLDVLEGMGARIGYGGRQLVDGEPVGDLEVQGTPLTRVTVMWDQVPSMIDELPMLALVSHFGRGETVVRGAGELRHKESDRIVTIVRALRAIGINAQEIEDGFIVRGSRSRPEGGTIDAAGDHRIAMLGGVAGLVSRKGVTVVGAGCVAVSFPGFFDLLDRLAVR